MVTKTMENEFFFEEKKYTFSGKRLRCKSQFVMQAAVFAVVAETQRNN